MPNGKTHAGITAATTAGTLITGMMANLSMTELTLMSLGCLLTLWIHPDLDQAEVRRGPWHAFWWPYGKFVKHRSWISHFPVAGTILRILYLGSLIGLSLWLVWPRISPYFPVISLPDLPWLWIIAGMIVSDTNHYLADIISTAFKRAV